MKNTSPDTVVNKVFDLFSVSEVAKTNNGPPFNGNMWTCSAIVRGPPSQDNLFLANAQPEGFNKPLMKPLKVGSIKHGALGCNECLGYIAIHLFQFQQHRPMFSQTPRTKLSEVAEELQSDGDVVIRNG